MRINRNDQSMDYRPLYDAYGQTVDAQAVRLVNRKTGGLRVSRSGMPLLFRAYLFTPFHTLLQSNWIWLLLLFVTIYVGQFVIFGVAYLAISPADDPCIGNVSNYADAYSFSVQTAMTIGYGNMYPKPECASTWILVTVQCVLMLLTDAIVLGTVFEKLSRPEVSTKTLIFSEKAVICERDGVPRLLMRTACLRRTFMIEAHVRLYCSNHHVTKEGERVFNFKLLPLAHDHEDYIFLGIPFEIEHIIDEESPLYGVSDISRMDIEFLVLIEGIVANMSDTVQARYSYRPQDILVGHKFAPCVTRKPDGSYEVAYERFNDIVEMPRRAEPSIPLFSPDQDPVSFRVLPDARVQKEPARTVTFGEDSVEKALQKSPAMQGILSNGVLADATQTVEEICNRGRSGDGPATEEMEIVLPSEAPSQ